MRDDIIKTYWQARDENGAVFLHNEKPLLKRGFFQCTKDGDCTSVMLFPIELKPLQIAEITVNENGTWSYEIEREEGWYMARNTNGDTTAVVKYCGGGDWIYFRGAKFEPDECNWIVSSTRIPNECII